MSTVGISIEQCSICIRNWKKSHCHWKGWTKTVSCFCICSRFLFMWL